MCWGAGKLHNGHSKSCPECLDGFEHPTSSSARRKFVIHGDMVPHSYMYSLPAVLLLRCTTKPYSTSPDPSCRGDARPYLSRRYDNSQTRWPSPSGRRDLGNLAPGQKLAKLHAGSKPPSPRYCSWPERPPAQSDSIGSCHRKKLREDINRDTNTHKKKKEKK